MRIFIDANELQITNQFTPAFAGRLDHLAGNSCLIGHAGLLDQYEQFVPIGQYFTHFQPVRFLRMDDSLATLEIFSGYETAAAHMGDDHIVVGKQQCRVFGN